MFDLQTIIVAVILIGAVAYASSMFLRKARGFSRKSACADDCGCSSKSKTIKIAH
jgi:hypothetical protein